MGSPAIARTLADEVKSDQIGQNSAFETPWKPLSYEIVRVRMRTIDVIVWLEPCGWVRGSCALLEGEDAFGENDRLFDRFNLPLCSRNGDLKLLSLQYIPFALLLHIHTSDY